MSEESGVNDFSLRATSDDTRLTFHGELLSRARQSVAGITTTEVCIYRTTAGDYVVSLADLVPEELGETGETRS
jgi:hypothetical protein